MAFFDQYLYANYPPEPDRSLSDLGATLLDLGFQHDSSGPPFGYSLYRTVHRAVKKSIYDFRPGMYANNPLAPMEIEKVQQYIMILDKHEYNAVRMLHEIQNENNALRKQLDEQKIKEQDEQNKIESNVNVRIAYEKFQLLKNIC